MTELFACLIYQGQTLTHLVLQDSLGGDERFAAAGSQLSSFKRVPAMGGRVLDQRHREEKRSR